MGHDHAHSHDAGHFLSCVNPKTCFCEVWKYFLATLAGFFFASFQWWLATKWAGSYGAEGDAFHMFADSSFVLVSMFLALWKHYDKKHRHAAEMLGISINSAFLIFAGLAIFYRLYFMEEMHRFSGIWMFAAGMVGLVGNIAQFVILKGEEEGLSMLSTTRQHVFYDLLYSLLVLAGAVITWAGVWERQIDILIAYILAVAMLYSGGNNILVLLREHRHAHDHE